MTPTTRLILASASPRRRELLRAVGVPFRVVPSRIEEIPRPGEPPLRFVRRAAREKAEEVAARNPSSFVLSADTIVVAKGKILGKPADRKEGRRMLSLLAGHEHLVHTAACLHRADGGYRDGLCVTTRVRFRHLTKREIAAYLRTGESDDKAGAYAAQGAGNLLIDRICGSFTNVVGLPMTQTLAMLLRAGLIAVSRKGPGWYDLTGRRS
ncbi:MAG TPA: Maf family protein [Candidatus Limnocylindrales bacterium]|nr:Maf family protein [Candidatus Limnocylindrales bacterium]